jgi:organic hydroperoxide reductase OsmC/OhrA
VAEYKAVISWRRDDAIFTDNRYRRAHVWSFDGGVDVPASSSPESVPVPLSEAAAVDPEEAFVASLSSCHMLWFLSIAAKRGFTVDEYRDDASGTLARNIGGKVVMTLVTLRPAVVFSGKTLPSEEELVELHHTAHEECYIANSVKTEVRCEPVMQSAPG